MVLVFLSGIIHGSINRPTVGKSASNSDSSHYVESVCISYHFSSSVFISEVTPAPLNETVETISQI